MIQAGLRSVIDRINEYIEVMENNLTSHLPKDSYDLIDILPLPIDPQGGKFAEVQKYLLRKPKKVAKRFAGFFLKLYCYHDLEIDFNTKEYVNPKPKKLVRLIEEAVTKDLMLQIRTGQTDFLITGKIGRAHV